MKLITIAAVVLLASRCTPSSSEAWASLDGLSSVSMQIDINSVTRGRKAAVGRVTAQSRMISKHQTDWTNAVIKEELVDCLAGSWMSGGVTIGTNFVEPAMIFPGDSDDVDDIEGWTLIDRVCSEAGFPLVEREGRVRRYVRIPGEGASRP